jgi:hypothetical protein
VPQEEQHEEAHEQETRAGKENKEHTKTRNTSTEQMEREAKHKQMAHQDREDQSAVCLPNHNQQQTTSGCSVALDALVL